MTESGRQSGLIECGKEAAAHFAFADGYRNLNHGSYGTYPFSVRDVFRSYQERIEARPDAFVRFEYRTHLLSESRSAIAKYLNVPPETCVFTPNATTGIDTILRNLIYEPGDVVICFSTVYDSFDFTLQYLTETTPLGVHKIPYSLPVSDAHICDVFESAVSALKSSGKRPRLAIFDTINSIPGTRMPFERLTELCRRHAVLSCVDAAHGVGHLALDLAALDPDFLVSNCHKWLYVPRGCAVLYVPPRNQRLLRITMPSGFHFVPLSREGEMDFVMNFSDTGTMDNAPLLCVPAGLEWRGRLVWDGKEGEEAVMGYTRKLAREGGKVVAGILGTQVLENDEGTLGECNFSNVRLPLDAAALTGGDRKRTRQLTQWMARAMIVENETAVYVIPYAGDLWVRLSAQVYLTLDDFEFAGQKLKETCKRVEAGEWLRK